MEYRRRSLWNRIWDDESLDTLGHEEYVRRIYEGESRPWMEIGHGFVLSVWKGIRWLLGKGQRGDQDRGGEGDEDHEDRVKMDRMENDKKTDCLLENKELV